MESLVMAVQNGANAVYLGGTKFSARAYATNFTEKELEEAVDYCHSYDVRVNITLNTLLKDSELEEAVSYASYLYEIGVDALDETQRFRIQPEGVSGAMDCIDAPEQVGVVHRVHRAQCSVCDGALLCSGSSACSGSAAPGVPIVSCTTAGRSRSRRASRSASPEPIRSSAAK